MVCAKWNNTNTISHVRLFPSLQYIPMLHVMNPVINTTIISVQKRTNGKTLTTQYNSSEKKEFEKYNFKTHEE